MLTPETHSIKTAIISVSDKSGIADFAKALFDLGIEIYSTGGTAKTISSAGVPVKSISEITGFPEILDGRVKTLHPKVHGGILADLENEFHQNQMEDNSIKSIDMLVVNLYPFEEHMAGSLSDNEMIEYIDIGGPAMLRAAAKNYRWTLPVVDPDDYPLVLDSLKDNDLTVTEDVRKKLAARVFAETAYYDSIISQWFNNNSRTELPQKTTIALKAEQKMRYGENPHQNAALYGNFGNLFEQLHGKQLSYNNIVDIDAAAKLIVEFNEPTFAIVKHTNPCGVATAETLPEAYEKAFATDTVSPFGGIFTVNRTIDRATAETIHKIFSEVIIAPDFSDEALEILTKKRDRRLIRADLDKLRNSLGNDLRSVAGGYLIQNTDTKMVRPENLKTVTKRVPTEEELKSLLFGWIIVKHVKSNSIVYTKADRTIGIGAGQMSRVDSARIAVEKAKLMGLELEGTTVASDAFFPFADGVEQVADAGATAVIQPGGSVRDEEVIEAADKLGLAMVFTGNRHFRH